MIPEREARKLAAIMFTDMVGYAALTQRNEADALELLAEHQRLLGSIFSRHGGQIINTTGDGFFVEFASVLEAARCAIAIQRTLHDRNSGAPASRRIQVRIGIHLGDVVHRENDVFGDGVNIASRIEPFADPGGICISQQVRDQIQNRIDAPIVRLGRRELKNIQTPVILYQLVLPWERRRGHVARQLPHTLRGQGTPVLVITLVVVLTLGISSVWQRVAARRTRPVPHVSQDRQRIAVLPFANASNDRTNDYFAVGMTRAIRTDLGQIRSVRVVSPDSVEQFRKAGKTDPEIGRELGAGTVLVGTVQRSADQLRVNVQLLDVTSGDQLWAERFDQLARRLFDVQDHISRSVAAALRLALTSGEEKNLQRRPTQNLEAYDCYLRARFHSGNYNREDIDARIRLLEKAVALDPAFADAYASLARAYGEKRFFLEPQKKHWDEMAAVAVDKAIALAPDLAEAHFARGRILWTPFNRFPHGLAIKEARHALDLNPNLDEARNFLALIYNHVGLFDKARQELKQAMEINPVNRALQLQTAFTHYHGGSYKQALAALEECPREPNPTIWEWGYASSLLYLGREQEAFARIQKFLRNESKDEGGMVTGVEAVLFATEGNERRAEETIQQAIERGKGFGHFHHTAYAIGSAYALMKKPDRAMRWLEEAANNGFPCYPAYATDSNLASLRANPRFIAFLAKLKEQWEGYRRL